MRTRTLAQFIGSEFQQEDFCIQQEGFCILANISTLVEHFLQQRNLVFLASRC